MKRVLVTIAVTGLAASLSPAAVRQEFSRYMVILDREPFGASAVLPEAPAVSAVSVEQSFVKDLRMCAITDTEIGVRVGLVSLKGKPPKSYYLRIGASEDGIELVDADFEKLGALLRKGKEERWIYMDGNPGEITSPAKKIVSRGPPPLPRRLSYRERLRERREAATQALLRQRKQGAGKLANRDMKKQIDRYQLEAVRSGKRPLPIPLSKEVDDQLVKEGVLPPNE